MRLETAEALRRAAAADHGVLATLHPERGADLVPVCFAIVDDVVAIPIDRLKPKSGATLARVRNLAADPRATLLLEHWDPADWSRLWWVRLALQDDEVGEAERARLETALRGRYVQYRDAAFARLLTFRIRAATGWSAE